MIETYVDSGLFEPENKQAVQQVCALTAQHLREIANVAKVGHDDLLGYLLCALDRIGAGECPNEAFGWAKKGKGRQLGNHTLRNWEIRMTVRDRMLAGASLEQACGAVSAESGGEFLLSFESIKGICKGLKAGSDLPMPDNIFPTDQTPYRRR